MPPTHHKDHRVSTLSKSCFKGGFTQNFVFDICERIKIYMQISITMFAGSWSEINKWSVQILFPKWTWNKHRWHHSFTILITIMFLNLPSKFSFFMTYFCHMMNKRHEDFYNFPVPMGKLPFQGQSRPTLKHKESKVFNNVGKWYQCPCCKFTPGLKSANLICSYLEDQI